MGDDDDQKGDVQDPAEPKRVETVVETHEAKETTVSEPAESGDDSGSDSSES